MKENSISIFIWLLCIYLTLAQRNENCECSPPCLGTNEDLSECPGRKAPRLDCPCCEVCLQQEGKKCREPDLPCDKDAGLHCSPRRKGLCQECGVNRREPFLTRIFGGQPASPKDWPWMAALVKAHERGTPFCGGTLISDTHIITASHCLENFSPRDVIVRLGEYDFGQTLDNNPMDFEIKKIQKHEKYNRGNFDNDIAILSLKTAVNFNEYIWPACLPPPNVNIVNKLGLVAGWGTDSFLGSITNILREIAIKVWTHDDCVKAQAERTITDNMMCVGWASGKADSCQGDSGGPFVLKLEGSHQWLLTGIVSWGQECGRRDKPGVYTVVANYLDWIEYHTQNETPTEPATPVEDVNSPSSDVSTPVCENGYEQIKSIDWCVKANTDTKNWWQASQTCESDGGTLAVIDTKEKFDAISEMIQVRQITDLWIGLSDLKFEGNFEWVDGTRLSKESFSWWGPSQPDDGEHNEDCVHYSSSWQYKWNDVTCHALFSYLCEQKMKNTKTVLKASASDYLKALPSSCPSGWAMNPDSKLCYHVGDEKLSFDKSKEYCRNKEGYLAMVLSTPEMSYARGFLNNNKSDEVWIGLRRSRTGLFRWIDDRPLSFRSWTTSQPDNRDGIEDCVSMDKSNSYLWNDDACYKFKRPLCMKKIPSRVRRFSK